MLEWLLKIHSVSRWNFYPRQGLTNKRDADTKLGFDFSKWPDDLWWYFGQAESTYISGHFKLQVQKHNIFDNFVVGRKWAHSRAADVSHSPQHVNVYDWCPATMLPSQPLVPSLFPSCSPPAAHEFPSAAPAAPSPVMMGLSRPPPHHHVHCTSSLARYLPYWVRTVICCH